MKYFIKNCKLQYSNACSNKILSCISQTKALTISHNTKFNCIFKLPTNW